MSILFEPSSIGRRALKNRIVRSAFLENVASPDGLPTDDTLRLYERLARGGVGLIITGMAYVSPRGKGQPLQHGAHIGELPRSAHPVTVAPGKKTEGAKRSATHKRDKTDGSQAISR